MKIIHFLNRVHLEDGGVVRCVLDLCTLLSSHGHEVVFMSPDGRDVPADWREGSLGRPRAVDLNRTGPAGLLSRAALREVRRQLAGAEAVHLHGMWELCNYQVAAAARRVGTPYIYSPHGMLDDWAMATSPIRKRALLALAGCRILEQARSVLCAAEGELKQSSRWFPRGQGRVVPLVFDLEPFRELPGPDLARRTFGLQANQTPTILFLSRLVENKGALILLDAAARLRAQEVEFNLVVAGTGSPSCESALRRQAAELGLRDHAIFVGHVGGAEKISLFQAADLFVLPTEHENFGFALVEALACGTPAVTTYGAMIWNELQQGGGTSIVERSPESTAEAIRTLIGNPQQRDRMGKAGREWVFRYLDPATLARQFESLYRN